MTDNALSMIEEQAFQLSRYAIALDNAWQSRDTKPGELTAALDGNLEVWVTLKALINKPECNLAPETRTNLLRLCDFVAGTTFNVGQKLDESVVSSLVNINLQISEGLLEGAKKS